MFVLDKFHLDPDLDFDFIDWTNLSPFEGIGLFGKNEQFENFEVKSPTSRCHHEHSL